MPMVEGVKEYQLRKPVMVQAILLTEENMHEALHWAGWISNESAEVWVKRHTTIGQYLVQNGGRFITMSAGKFKETYQSSEA